MCKHPDTLTAEELSIYQPGWHCICLYSNPKDCTCGANWTPREVYELRNMVLDLENQLSEQKELMIAAAGTLDTVKKQRDENDRAKSDLESTEKMLQRAEAVIAGVEYAAEHLISKELRKAMFILARKHASGLVMGPYEDFPLPVEEPLTSNYALEA